MFSVLLLDVASLGLWRDASRVQSSIPGAVFYGSVGCLPHCVPSHLAAQCGALLGAPSCSRGWGGVLESSVAHIHLRVQADGSALQVPPVALQSCHSAGAQSRAS